MNYLAHYYISKKDNIYYNTGLILPDLLRGEIKRINKTDISSLCKEHQYLLNGCLQHYVDDKKFHSSAFFEFGNKLFLKIVNENIFEPHIHRKWFLGHIFFELYIDRFLVNHLKGLVNNFYNDLNAIDEKTLKTFFVYLQCKNVDVAYQYFLNFSTHQYIKNYTDNNLFAYSLSRIMKRAHSGEFTLHDRLLIHNCLNQLDNLILKDKQTLLYLLHNTFA